tara:strand:- start:2343 stop:2987 length:645 start_codon:yes stop_codon:yes gene_type:complete
LSKHFITDNYKEITSSRFFCNILLIISIASVMDNMPKIKKKIIDQCPNLDINFWKKNQLLFDASEFDIAWTTYDYWEYQATIEVKLNNMIVNIYLVFDDGHAVIKSILLDATACHYGGIRYWLLCPCCKKRAAKLYLVDQDIKCIRCSGYSYQSQNETHKDRQLRLARKARYKLGAGGNLLKPIFQKPKGMHWRTFFRLRDQADAFLQYYKIDV